MGELPISLPRLSAKIRSRDLAAERNLLLQERARADSDELRQYFDDRLVLFEERAGLALSSFPDGIERPVHNDYNQYNYLFDVTPPPIILDWDRAIAAPREFEVVRCLNHLPVVASESARRFLDAYRGVRPLDQRRLAWAVDAALTEHALKHWPVERWRRGEPGASEQLSGTMALVRALALGRSQLDEFYA
jgi:Ser/Thr protein kinase RdoA (MazF antagonist)